MNTQLRLVGRIAAVLAFAFCFFGGAWILRACWMDRNGGGGDAFYFGVAWYFMGKAFVLLRQVCVTAFRPPR